MGAVAHRATQSARAEDVERRWYVVDAENATLGRLATRVATVLRGKHKAIVVNAEKVRLTGRKREQKTYYRHTGYPGHLRSATAHQVLSGPHADRVVREAVRGMLPKNALGRKMLRKLKVHTGPDHPHAAQQPEVMELG